MCVCATVIMVVLGVAALKPLPVGMDLLAKSVTGTHAKTMHSAVDLIVGAHVCKCASVGLR